ncbi:MAG: 2-dehydropantoate 2-reductase [Oricola sp.]
MTIGIYGAGSIGCHVGGMLAASGKAPVLVGRATMGERLANGITVTRFDGTERRAEPESFTYSTEATALSDCDTILVCVKSDATRDCGERLAGVARPEAVVVSLQNGISNPATLREVLGGRTVLAGMIGFNVAQIGADRFHCGTEGEIVVGAGQGAEAVANALSEAGIATIISPDIEAVQWGKLLYNLNNPVNALSGIPLKRELSTRAYRQVFAALIREALTVLKAAGVRPAKIGKVGPGLLAPILDLPDWLFLRIAAGMLSIDENAKTSMLEDIEKGRAPEVDWLNGEIVALGKKTGVPTPANERIVALVKASFSGNGPRRYDGPELKKAALA